MLAATTWPWYVVTWVNRATPVTSPTAHTPGPARHRTSTATPPRPVSVTPAVSSPSTAVLGPRPAPRITTSVSTWLPSSSVTTVISPALRALTGVTPVRTVTPAADSARAASTPT